MVEYAYDKEEDFSRGQDASKDPHHIEPGAYYAGINVNVENGNAKPRWGVHRKGLTFQSGGIVVGPNRINTYENIFRSGRFQAFIPYFVGSTHYLIIVISGIIFILNPDDMHVSVIPIADGSFISENHSRVNWSSAGPYLVIFDFPNYPVIIENFGARRSDPTLYEVPISVLGAYNQNRLFIANAGNEFTGGDPSGNLATPNAPITFEEVEVPAATYLGQIFQLPTNYNNEPITAMGFLQLIDVSTGFGPLWISTPSGIYSYNTQNPRSTWEAGSFGTKILNNNGVVGAQAYVNVNSDLFFLASDGQVRSLSMARDEQHKWSNVPISREVKNWLGTLDHTLLKYTTFGYYNNKLFISANPTRIQAFNKDGSTTTDYMFKGLVVLSSDNLATLNQSGPPAWDGLWTGVRPLAMATSNNRFFVMSKDEFSSNHLYEFDIDTTIDTNEQGIERPIRSVIYTRSYSFNSSQQNKELHSMDVSLVEVQGNLTFDVKYRPSQTEKFLQWRTFKHCAPYKSCLIPTDLEVNGLSPHSFKSLYLGSPIEAEECDIITRDLYNIFRKVQLKITIEGKYWEIEEFVIKSILRKQSENEVFCDEFPCEKLYAECNNDWYIGPFESCQTIV